MNRTKTKGFDMSAPGNIHHLLSHAESTIALEDKLHKLEQKIKKRGDQPHVTVKRQLDLLKQLTYFELGKFLILNQGLNGYWTHYILTYPMHAMGQAPFVGLDPMSTPLTELEKFLLERSPVMIATQERFRTFLQQNQTAVQNDAKLACIPSGLLGELLYLNFQNCKNVQLIGIDYDTNVVKDMMRLAQKLGHVNMIKFNQADAWEIQLKNEFNLISSNGLNIYEPDNNRVTALYSKFYDALKPNGKLVTSFLTFPPHMTENCEWNMAAINKDDLLLQKIIFADILEAKWQCFRSTQETRAQLESVGFKNIQFIFDKAKIFPTVIAKKENE